MALHLARDPRALRALKAKLPDCTVEVLTPDFLGVEEAATVVTVLEGWAA